MNTINGSVDVRGTVNTVDYERVMNQFSSSFTESFIKVMEKQIGMVFQPTIIEEFRTTKEKPMSKSLNYQKVEIKNRGFEKLKTPILKMELEKCKSAVYDITKLITIKDLGIKSIYELDKRSNKFWKEYFSKYKVYLRKGLTSSKISPKILFDNRIEGMLNVGKLESIDSNTTLPQ
jgi:hypothetical protein